MSADDQPPRPPHRSYARAGAGQLDVEDRDNATVVTPITIQNTGRLGAPDFTRTLEPGTRVEIVETDPSGLVRILFPSGGDRGTLVHQEALERDDAEPSRRSPSDGSEPERDRATPGTEEAWNELFADRHDG